MRSIGYRVWLLIGLILFLLCLNRVWYPYVEYYVVDDFRSVENEEIYKLQITPDNQKLDKILTYDSWSPALDKLGLSNEKNLSSLVNYGILSATDGSMKVYPFTKDHLLKGNSSQQLAANGLLIVKALVNQYRLTDKQVFLRAAKSYLVDFIDYESTRVFDHSFLFNDHAVASRVYVVSYFWRHYRGSDEFDVQTARKIVEYMGTLTNRLLKKTFYTYRTNHGLMQNVALLLAATVFDTMPESTEWRTVGNKRLDEQLQYLVSREGFFLEHSFEYHRFLIELLVSVIAYADVGESAVSERVLDVYKRGVELNRLAQRFDNTLPAVGDTSFKPESVKDLNSYRKDDGLNIYADSGFALSTNTKPNRYCSQGESQNTLFWQNIAGHGHKHWDDMTIDIWDCSTQWWRASGYVPYWHKFRASSEKWYGANAPHLNNETLASGKSAKINGYYSSDKIQYLSLGRKSSDNTIIVREYLQLDYLTIIYDYLLYGKGDDTLVTYWTMSHDKKLIHFDRKAPYKYLFADDSKKMEGAIIGNNGNYHVEAIQGDDSSILGWVEVNSALKPTVTLRAEAKGEKAYLMNVFAVRNDDQSVCNPAYQLNRSFEAENYNLIVSGCGIDTELNKRGNELRITQDSRQTVLNTQSFSEAVPNAERSTLEDAISEYGVKFRPLVMYRERISYLVGLLFLGNILFYFVQNRFSSMRIRLLGNFSVIVAWFGTYYWIGHIYLAY